MQDKQRVPQLELPIRSVAEVAIEDDDVMSLSSSSSEGDAANQLHRKLRRAMQEKDGNIDFMPTKLLAQILTRDEVEASFEANGISDFSLVDKICLPDTVVATLPGSCPLENSAQNTPRPPEETYIFVFAILLLLGRVDQLPKVVRHLRGVAGNIEDGFCDADLPLIFSKPKEQVLGPRRLRCLEGKEWSVPLRDGFKQSQRKFMVPFFAFGKHQDLKDDAVLPWLTLNQPTIEAASTSSSASSGSSIAWGGFAVVSKVRLHPLSHDFATKLDHVSAPQQATETSSHFARRPSPNLFKPDDAKNTSQISVENNQFALKSLLRPVSATPEVNNEAAVLARFGERAHPALITLLSTFTYGNHFHFLFPWAGCNLEEWWERTPHKSKLGDVEFARWIASQCASLMDALDVIHNPKSRETRDNLLSVGTANISQAQKELYVRHGDLKPKNILWFENPPSSHSTKAPNAGPNLAPIPSSASSLPGLGSFVIADFGLSAAHGAMSRSADPNDQVGRTDSYQAPEMAIEGGVIRRAYDLWTVGCIFLELCTWYLQGLSGVEQFSLKRRKAVATGMADGTETFFIARRFDGPESEGQGKKEEYVIQVKSEVTEVSYCNLSKHSPCPVPWTTAKSALACAAN
jgi:serine/threonine protein kinase